MKSHSPRCSPGMGGPWLQMTGALPSSVQRFYAFAIAASSLYLRRSSFSLTPNLEYFTPIFCLTPIFCKFSIEKYWKTPKFFRKVAFLLLFSKSY